MNSSRRLELYLLGAFRATLDSEPVLSFRADSGRALLAYLAMHPGVVFRRETLATLLWSEHHQDAALVNLRQILSILRRVLGDAEAEQPFLEITPRTICLAAEACVCVDVNQFRELVGSTIRHASPTSQLDTERMVAALSLYRGDILSDLYIASPAFDEWLFQEREQLHRRAVELLSCLASYYARRGDPERVKDYAQWQLRLEPWSEEAYQHLMLAYALLGERSAALVQYALCQRALLTAFGVEPTEKTKSLHRKLANNDLDGLLSEFQDPSVSPLDVHVLFTRDS